MSTEKNKEMVHDFFDRFQHADVSGALDLLDDSVVWRVMGRDGGLPLSGKMNKNDVGGLIKTIKETFPKGLEFEFLEWTAEGDRVAVEIESYGEKKNGTVYNNFYHFLLKIAGEKIITVKEFMDTLHVKHVFIDD